MTSPDRVGPQDLAQIEALITCVGWERARRLFVAVASIDRRDHVRFLSHREAQTMKIALALLQSAHL